jgi:MFS family permease
VFPAATIDPAAIPAAQARIRRALIAEVALGSTGYIAAITIGTLVVQDLLGSSALAGVPSATVVLGASSGSILLSSLMARRGRRPGLVLGYAVAVVGALLAASAVVARSFPLLIVGTILLGWGNSANQLSRYAAADMVPPAKRANAISLVVWASTVGAVIGPSLVAPAGALASSVGLPELAGPYLVPVVVVTLSAILSFALLRPDPMALADHAISGADPASRLHCSRSSGARSSSPRSSR